MYSCICMIYILIVVVIKKKKENLKMKKKKINDIVQRQVVKLVKPTRHSKTLFQVGKISNFKNVGNLNFNQTTGR